MPTSVHRDVGVGDVVLDLLQRAGGQEARRRDREDLLSRRRQARGDADEVLLGDADLDDLLRQRLRRTARACRSRASRSSPPARCGPPSPAPAACRRTPRGSAGPSSGRAAARPRRPRACTWTGRARSCAPPPSVAAHRRVELRRSPRAYSASLGTPWCHLATSSMKLTPLPLIVLAMTASGLPVSGGGVEHVGQLRRDRMAVDRAHVPAERRGTFRRAARCCTRRACGR